MLLQWKGMIKTMNTKERIIEIITKLTGDECVSERLNQNDNLTQFGLDSVSFIKLVVSLEAEFDIEFEDEALDYNNYISFKMLCDYVENKIVAKSN